LNTGPKEYHTEVVFEPGQDGFVVAGFNFGGPVATVVKVAVQAWHADADGVLGTGDFNATGFVFEAEEYFGQLFGMVEG